MTRARDIAGGTIFTSADHTKLDGIATGATAYVHPTGAGNQHVPAAGAAGQALLYASAGTAAWGTISTSDPAVVFPNWASPTTTYTTSGTWSKGSLDDDDYVWFYLIGGGGGGSTYYNSQNQNASGGNGGNAMLLYGKAGLFDGGAYVIGAGVAGQAGTGGSPIGTNSTFTLSSTYGSIVFSGTGGDGGLFQVGTKGRVADSNLPTITLGLSTKLTTSSINFSLKI